MTAVWPALAAMFALATAQSHREAAIPVAPPRIVLEGTPDVPRQGPHPLRVTFPMDHRGKFEVPQDSERALNLLRAGLPREYIDALAWTYGFKRNGTSAPPDVTVLARTVDLEMYLRRIWRTADTGTRLGRQLKCISPGDSELWPLLEMLVWGLLESNYSRRDDVPADVDLYRTFHRTYRLRSFCQHRSR